MNNSNRNRCRSANTIAIAIWSVIMNDYAHVHDDHVATRKEREADREVERGQRQVKREGSRETESERDRARSLAAAASLISCHYWQPLAADWWQLFYCQRQNMDANCLRCRRRSRRRHANNLLEGATFLRAGHVGQAFYKWQHILAIIRCARSCCFQFFIASSHLGATQSANCRFDRTTKRSQRSAAQSALPGS